MFAQNAFFFKNILTTGKNELIVKALVEEQILFQWEYRPKYPKRAKFHTEGWNDRMIVSIFVNC